MSSKASAVQSLINGTDSTLGSAPDMRLAIQIAHTLRHQHDWKDLRIHDGLGGTSLPVTMISGMPPQRLYIHPDEQIELLQKQKKAGKTGLPEMTSEREWVLPTHLRDKWSLKRFSDVFDTITIVPDPEEGVLVPFDYLGQDANEQIDHPAQNDNPWRTVKRVALATLDDDSTVVFYIVHDAIVKPRQN